MVHPDAQNPAHVARAEAAFKQLNHFYHLALAAKNGGGAAGIQENGVLANPIILTTKRYIHTIARRVKVGGTSTLFAGTSADKTTIHPCYFKVSNQASDNDLIEREAKALRSINQMAKGNKLANRVPLLLETVKLAEPEKKCVNVLEDREGMWYTLEENSTRLSARSRSTCGCVYLQQTFGGHHGGPPWRDSCTALLRQTM